MDIGLIDVDGHNFPNVALMKISAWHKQRGDHVDWYDPLGGRIDVVYKSKVFTFTEDYKYPIYAEKEICGGTGYYYPSGGEKLPDEIEHIYPDYDLYPTLCRDTAYGFLTRGCPRQCDFCIVSSKEGCRSRKVANLDEFWKGQKNIILLDPNITACRERKELLQQLVDSGAWVDFTQGIDIRTMTVEMAFLISKIKCKTVHFAWDRPEDERVVVPALKMFKDITGWDYRRMIVYMLTNYGSTFEQDLHRVYTIKSLGYSPYVMIYEKDSLPAGHKLKKLQRWVNSNKIFRKVETFEEYDA